MNEQLDDHAAVREHLEAYVAGGLTVEERTAIEKHAAGCAECGEVLRALEQVDRKMQGLFADARPGEDFEHRIVARLWHAGMTARMSSTTMRRVRYAIAASLLLGTTGLFGAYAVQNAKNNVLSNPLSGLLADSGGKFLPGWMTGVSEPEPIQVPKSFADGWHASATQLTQSSGKLPEALRGYISYDDYKNGGPYNNDGDGTGPQGGGPEPQYGFRMATHGKSADANGNITYNNDGDVSGPGSPNVVVGSPQQITMGRNVEALNRTNNDLQTSFEKAQNSIRSLQEPIAELQKSAGDKVDTFDASSTGMLLHARESDRDRTITPPALTLYNGQAAYIAAGKPADVSGIAHGGGFGGKISGSGDGAGGGAHYYDRPDNGPLAVGGSGNFDSGYIYNNRGIHPSPNEKSESKPSDGPVAFRDVDGLSVNGTLTKVGGDALTINGTGAVNGILRGTSNLLKSGSGTWALSGANTYTGGTTVNSGTLTVGGNSGTVAVNGGTLGLSNSAALGSDGAATWGNVASNWTDSTTKGLKPGAVPFDITKMPVRSDKSYSTDGADAGGGVPLFREKDGKGAGESGKERVGLASGRKYFGENTDPAEASVPDAAKKESQTPLIVTTGSTVLVAGTNVLGRLEDGKENHVDSIVAVNNGPSGAPSAITTPPAPPPAPAAPSAAAQAAVLNQKIIRTGTMEFEVSNFDDAAATITSVITEEGGFVAGTNSEKLPNGKVKGTITVRMEPGRLDRVVLKLRGLGELKTQQITAQDITKEYTDLESQLRADRTMEDRMLDIIKNGKGEVKDLVEAEKQLGVYRSEIERIEGEKRYYDNMVGLSTLTITLFEKDIQAAAKASEMENVVMSVETEEVEAKFSDAKGFIEKDAGGRIIKAELRKYQADQLLAQIVCEVPPEKADFLIVQLRQLGKVAQLDRDRSQSTQDGQTTVTPNMKVEQKNTQISLSLYNLTAVNPRQTAVLVVAVPNVEEAYNKVLGRVRQDVHVDKPVEGAPAKPIGVVVTSNLSGQQIEQMSANIRADVRITDAPAVLTDIRAMGEVMSSTLTENPDTANVTTSKEGIQLTLVARASVQPRETQTLQVAAADVPDAYKKLVDAMRTLQGEKGGRILQSQLNQQDQTTITGVLDVELPRESQNVFEAALTGTGADVVARNVARSTDMVNTLDSKVRYIMNLNAADAMPAKENSVITLEVEDVEKALGDIRTSVIAGDGRELDVSKSKDANGNVVARMMVDVPIAGSPALLAKLQSEGKERTHEIAKNPQGESGKLARARYDITLTAAGSLPAKENALMELEVDDVERALADIRTAIAVGDGRELDAAKSKDPSGRVIAQIVVDVPIAQSPSLLAKLQAMGKELANKVTTNPQGEDGKLSRARYEITLSNMAGLVPQDESIGSTLRAAATTSLRVLFRSLYLIFSGLMMVGPWLLTGWVLWRVLWRKKKSAA